MFRLQSQKVYRGFLVFMALILGLTGLGFTSQPAVAQQANQPTTIDLGTMGVFSPYFFDKTEVTAKKVYKSSLGFEPLDFLMPLIQVKSSIGSFPQVMTYVFFEVPHDAMNERHIKTAKDLTIYYTSGGSWNTCGTTFVVADSINSGNDRTRVACVVTNLNATYGVARSKTTTTTTTSTTTTTTTTQAVAKTANTIPLGPMGVFSPYGLDLNDVSAKKVSKSSVSAESKNFLMPLIQVKAKHGSFPQVMTYVFFEVPLDAMGEQNIKSAKDLNIYYTSGGGWKTCGTTFVVDSLTDESDNRVRVACVVTNLNATYGVAK